METAKAIALFLSSREGKGLSPDSMRWYAGILRRFGGEFRRLPRRPAQIEAFLASLSCGDERRTGYYRALHSLYRFLRRRRIIGTDPMEFLDPPRRSRKLPRYLTADQLDQLLRYPHPTHIKACLLFLADTGCRVGELLSLNPESFIDTPRGWVAYINGKTGQRIVPLETETVAVMMKQVPIRWSRWWLSRQLARAFEAAHVPGNGARLRHTFGTLWDGEDMDLQDIMGHSNISTTKIYRHLRTERLCEQHHLHTPLRQILTATKRMI